MLKSTETEKGWMRGRPALAASEASSEPLQQLIHGVQCGYRNLQFKHMCNYVLTSVICDGFFSPQCSLWRCYRRVCCAVIDVDCDLRGSCAMCLPRLVRLTPRRLCSVLPSRLPLAARLVLRRGAALAPAAGRLRRTRARDSPQPSAQSSRQRGPWWR